MDENPSLYCKSVNWTKHLLQHQTEIVSYTNRKYPNISSKPITFCQPGYNWEEGAFAYFCQNPHNHPLPLLRKEDYKNLLGIDYDDFDSKQYALSVGKSVKTPKYRLLCIAAHDTPHECPAEMAPYANINQSRTIPAPISDDLSPSRGSFLRSLEDKLKDQESVILD
jgi:hypothetical protein